MPTGQGEVYPMLEQLLQQYCTPAQWQQVVQFSNLVKTANQTINLVSRRDIDNLVEHHVAPSFAYRILNRLAPRTTVLDIGSGGGFPGIINAILFPDTYFILVDSTKKKVTFLQQSITTLKLSNVEAIWSRVEDLAKLPQYRHYFDYTTSRAVAPLNTLVEWSAPLLKPGGAVEAMKGGDIQSELDATLVVNRHACTLQTYHLPEQLFLNEKLRSLVIVSLLFNNS